MSNKALTECHVHWVEYDTDGNAIGTRTASADSPPHAIAYPPEADKPLPLKGTTALSPSGNLTTRFIELFSGQAPLPIYRFTNDCSVRLRDRESTTTGVTPGDALFREISDGDDFLVLEADIGTISEFILSET